MTRFKELLDKYDAENPNEELHFAWVSCDPGDEACYPGLRRKWRAWNTKAWAFGSDGLQAFEHLMGKLRDA
jgi:hypothetical protein